MRYTTELSDPVWFYVRGEEYSAQLDAFVPRVGDGPSTATNGFASAAITDDVIAAMVVDAARDRRTPVGGDARASRRRRRRPRTARTVAASAAATERR